MKKTNATTKEMKTYKVTIELSKEEFKILKSALFAFYFNWRKTIKMPKTEVLMKKLDKVKKEIENSPF